MDPRRKQKEAMGGSALPDFDAPLPAGAKPLPSFTNSAGGGPSFSVAPQYEAIDAEEQATDLDADMTIDDYRETVEMMKRQMDRMRSELRQGTFGGSGVGIAREGVVKMLSGDEEDIIPLVLPTQKFVKAELELIREEVISLIEEHKKEIKEELKELRDVAMPLLKMLSTLSKDTE
jgi:hypothetical protein